MFEARSPRCRHAVLLLAIAGCAALAAGPAAAQSQSGKPNQGTHTLTPEELKLRHAAAPQMAPVPPAEVIAGDHLAAGVGLRNRGGGTINLNGAPEKAAALRAFLYWDVVDNQATPSATVSVNGVAVSGRLIGQGATPCWGPSSALNLAYRAEVPLYLLYNGINGEYRISGVASGTGTGANPWDSPVTLPLAEGASLVVFYQVPNGTFQQTLVYEAPISGTMFGAVFNTVLGGFTATKALAKFTLIGADGQSDAGLSGDSNGSSETSFFQGVQIAGPHSGLGPQIDNDSDWNGQDGQPLNQLWDTRTHLVGITQGSTSASVQYLSNADCLVVVAFFLSL